MNLADQSDEAVVKLVFDNKEVYSELIRRYQKKITHYIGKFIHQSDELEDVLQAVFIKAYQNLHGFDTSKRFSPWIYRIAHNEAINYIKRRKVSVAVDEVEHLLIDEKIDLPAQVDLSMIKGQIESGLAALKPKYRDVLILYFFEQKSYEEISDILRVSTNTVGTLLLRGKKMLKNYLTYGKL